MKPQPKTFKYGEKMSSYIEDLIFITTYGIDISVLDSEDDDIMEELLDHLLGSLPKSMYAFYTEGRVGYDVNNITGSICASIERHREDERLRRIVFLKESSEIYDKENAQEFIVKTANFFGERLMQKLS